MKTYPTLILSTIIVCLTAGCVTKSSYKPQVGYVPDAETAIKVAVAVWEPIYGAQAIADQKPYRAHLTNGIWIVEGSLPESSPEQGIYVMGGVAIAEIAKANGRIFRVDHEK